ncbi:MAG: TonB-dependent receptor plug domain-containing protein, partial [Melioribacteraceae bacterium]|nr:TonB-dependent receptor plug domain-containing protein [Melioribacteraceae bacterium]
MKNFKYIIIYLFSFYCLTFAQTVPLNGIIKNSENRSPIENVSVMITELQLLTTSDASGKFSFSNMREGEYTITFSRIGYRLKSQTILIVKGFEINLEVSLTKTELMLGEAVVTSTRSSRIVKDVPLPIELIDEKTIERSIKISTSDVIEKGPGVSLVSDGTWATGVNIRGLSKQNIVYLIDGNRIETSTNITAGLSLIDLSNVKNIEIVKGGLSSLYGTGATGGVINIMTNRGSTSEKFYFNGFLNSSYASVNSGMATSVNLSA